MRKKSGSRILAAAVALLLALLAGAGLYFALRIRYHAVIMESGFTFGTEFLRESMTYGASYRNEDFDPEKGEEWLYDTQSPKSRTYIIADRSGLDGVFESFPPIDFDREMILVYCYTDIYSRERILKSVKCKDGAVKVKFTIKSNFGRADATAPARHILVVKMDKLDVTSAEFIYV